MPAISNDNREQSVKPMEDGLITVSHLSVEPMMVCGVNRKVNIGNYENIDVYAGVTIPLSREALESDEDLREAVAEAARLGFEMASEETYKRYEAIKGAS